MRHPFLTISQKNSETSNIYQNNLNLYKEGDLWNGNKTKQNCKTVNNRKHIFTENNSNEMYINIYKPNIEPSPFKGNYIIVTSDAVSRQ